MDEIKVNLGNLTDEERKTLMDLVEKGNKKETGNWKPENKEEYWVVNSIGITDTYIWVNDRTDIFQYDICNCFKTREEAKFHREELLVEGQIRRLAKEYNEGWKPNWGDRNESKCYIAFEELDGACCYRYEWCSGAMRLPSDMYFKSEELCKKAIKTIGEDRLKKYWFKVEE